MCGIIGCISRENCYEKLLSSLARLEYRGYDSAGVCLLSDSGTLRVVTTVSCLASEGGDRPTPWPYLHSYRLHGVEFDIS